MEYETRLEIKDLVERVTRIKTEDCPVCQCFQPMIIIDSKEEETTELYRCLGCFKVFQRELIEVA